MASFLRRMLLCRFDLCDLWYRKEEGGRQRYACAGCDRTSMVRNMPFAPMTLRDAPPPKTLSGGPIETPPPPTGGSAARRMPQIHNEMPPAGEPITGYMSKTGYEILKDRDDWSTTVYRDPRDLAPRGGIIKVEIRLIREIEEGML